MAIGTRFGYEHLACNPVEVTPMPRQVSYEDQIVGLLTSAPTLPSMVAPDRLDWEGVASFLALYDQAGSERPRLVEGMRSIIEDEERETAIRALVVDLAATLDLAQLESSVQKLRESSAMADASIHRAVVNYERNRSLAHRRILTPASAAVAERGAIEEIRAHRAGRG